MGGETYWNNYYQSTSMGTSTAGGTYTFTSSIYSTLVGLGGGGNGVLAPFDATTDGGNGGLYGAGGGGSGFARGSGQSPTSPGGSGSSGLCIVVEYY